MGISVMVQGVQHQHCDIADDKSNLPRTWLIIPKMLSVFLYFVHYFMSREQK